MRLNVNDSDSIQAPTESELKRCIAELSGDEFLILSPRNGYFVQTYLNRDGTFELEYRQGSSDQHFSVDSKSLTVKDVTNAFLLFLQESAEFNTGWASKPLHLHSQGQAGLSVSEAEMPVSEAEIPLDAMVEYHGVLMSADWPQEIEEAQERTHYTMEGERWRRLPLESSHLTEQPAPLCSECGVRVTQFHVPGCGVEECPRCHAKLVECGCGIDEEL